MRTAPAPDPDRAFDAGLAALDDGREAQALPLVRAAVAAYPQRARLHQIEALLHRSLDDLAPALRAFDAAARLAPRDARIALGRAHAALEAGLPAAAFFQSAAALAGDRRSVWPGLAAAFLQENGPKAAASCVASALVTDPGWVDGYWLLARYRWMLGEREESVESLRAIIARYPRELVLWRQLILILTQANLHAEALETVRAARAALGMNAAFDHAEASCLTELGALDAADAVFARLPAPAKPDMAVPLLRLHLRQGRARAAAALAEPLAAMPNGALVMPYLSAAWRLDEDARWEWLEGDVQLIGIHDLGGVIADAGRLAAVLRRLHHDGGQPLEQSVRGGTQTDGPLLSRLEPEIRALRRVLVTAIETYIAHLPPPDPRHPFLARARIGRVRFAGSWSVRLAGSGFHTNHVHPAGWISSAFYAALPLRARGGDPHAGWLAIGQPPAELGLDLPPIRLVEPRPGRLILFPSTMWHGTVPFSAGERMTVAFDVAPPLG